MLFQNLAVLLRKGKNMIDITKVLNDPELFMEQYLT